MNKPDLTEETVYDYSGAERCIDDMIEKAVFEEKTVLWHRAITSSDIVIMSKEKYQEFKAILEKYELIEEIVKGS